MNELIKFYPFNLASKIFGNDSEALKLYIPGLETAMQVLTTKERECIMEKYRDGKTLEEIGVAHGVTKERIRQIIEKGVRRLRLQHNKQMIYGTSYCEIATVTQENIMLRQQLSNLEKAFDSLSEMLKTSLTSTGVKTSAISIENVELTVRAFNILRRKGICTLGEVAAMSSYELMHLRNMGPKTYNEIANVLHAHGLCLADEDLADS